MDSPESWQLVIAGPGAGKSAVACQRIAYLIDEGIPAARILLISFTRTAIAELRDRIVSYAVAGEQARSVRISTLDSHAWSLRAGFEDQPLKKSLEHESYELSIERTITLFRQRQPDLLDFMYRLEHLFIDEAQDIVGQRADLVVEVLKSLSDTCGVTILADPAQAIYGFTNEEMQGRAIEVPLLLRLEEGDVRPLTRRHLTRVHRVKDGKLADLFLKTRKVIESADAATDHVSNVQQSIRENCGKDIGVARYESIPDFLREVRDDSMLVLFRWRADVLFASSYCSGAGIEHRMRMSNTPTIVKPWIGWLFAECVQLTLPRSDFERLWDMRSEAAAAPFAGENRDRAWQLLHRLAAAKQPDSIDLVQIRRVVSRSRPPVELSYPDFGLRGPILGTIHASKGREADTVVLVMPHTSGQERLFQDEEAPTLEEGRVYYVGATRARKMLIAAGSKSTGVGYLESGRIFRSLGSMRAQLEVGQDGDIDPLAHLAWVDRQVAQLALAKSVGGTLAIQARALPEHDYAIRLLLEIKGADGIKRFIEVGQFSQSFNRDFSRLWGRVDHRQKLKPPSTIPHLYLVAVGTVALSDEQRGAVQPPYSQSGFALIPVVKGFPLIQFTYRRTGNFF